MGETEMHNSCGEKPHGIGAVKKDMLLILDIISVAQVTFRGCFVVPGYCFNS